MPMIRHLPPELINQIAAGEVVERPASVAKELLENALDANAQHLTLHVRQGGQSLIRVDDDGHGMSKENLLLSIERHSTSKLPLGNLWDIRTFGFRGEALAAIASVSRVTLKSCRSDQEHGWALSITGGTLTQVTPVPFFKGTSVIVQDLFFATPARLNFMKTPGVELSYIGDILEKMALVHPGIAFTWHQEKRQKTYALGLNERMSQILGRDFLEHSFDIQGGRDGYEVVGRIGLPTHHRALADRQFFFVNARPVKDRMLVACLKAAFSDVMPRDRHALAVIFLTIPTPDLDVNVHPAKTEVRFRDARFVRSLLMRALKEGLMLYGKHIAHPRFEAPIPSDPIPLADSAPIAFSPPSKRPVFPSQMQPVTYGPKPLVFALEETSVSIPHETFVLTPEPPLDLGRPLGQIHDSYILAQNAQGLVLVDPHAAHERIVYEALKTHWETSLGPIQPFLIPISFPLTLSEAEKVSHTTQAIQELGFSHVINQMDSEASAFMCTLFACPSLFIGHDPISLFKDLLSLAAEEDGHAPSLLQRWRNHILGNWACRQSVKLGRSLTSLEMESLLRDIEKTPNSAQCNHGRAVYRIFSMSKLATFFDR
jgi:DNA mismatch repair protein MutL